MNPEDLLGRLRSILPSGSFLVGGAVRDRLMGVSPKDMDFLVPADAFAVGRSLSESLGGFFVPLDAQRNIARVVLRGGFDIDLQPVPPGGVDASLAERDVTINAIAERLSDGARIDPFGGESDIRRRLLRAVAEKNLDEDPLRILRVWRFSASLGFSIDPKLLAAVSDRSSLIWSVAPERIAEEWFHILAAPGSGRTLQAMADAGTLMGLFPELLPARGCDQNVFHHLDVFQHSLAAVSALDDIAADPARFFPESCTPFLAEYLARPLIGRRPRAAYLRFAGLLHDIEKPSAKTVDAEGHIHFYGHEKAGAETTAAICEKLRLANAESSLLRLLVAEHMAFGPGLYGPGANLDRFFYRLFRDFGGDDGVGLLLFSLSDRLASLGPALPADFNEKHRAFVSAGILRYIEEKDRVVPPKLISGADVMRALGIPPSPAVGRILERIRELQAEGVIRTKEDALRALPDLRE